MLFVSSYSPRVVGLRGSLSIQPVNSEFAGQLIFQHRATYVSLVTHESTCEVLAVLAGLRKFHRQRDKQSIDLTLRNGDQFLVVSIKETAKRKDSLSLGAIDFDYTLCEFRTTK